MRIQASVLLIMLGAILTFAVRAEPRIVDLQTTGWILMLMGAGGLILNHFVWERRKEAAEISGTAVHLYDHAGAMPTDLRDPRADD